MSGKTGIDSDRGGPSPEIDGFFKYYLFYFVIAIISVGLIWATDAVIMFTYVFVGFIGAMALLGIYHFLMAYPLVQNTYGIVIHISILILSTQEITGKLSMLMGLCIGTIVMAYWLKPY
ncbi:hypothetical protein [Halocatena marina]|uniref:hypothetical protein n=1 Tax=Halocatena marina TaxID=2934937 RepID=UPI00200E9414|nr:hypothetical protein [Halocatena marina]